MQLRMRNCASAACPDQLQLRRLIDQALRTVVMEAIVHGVFACSVEDGVEDLAAAPGLGSGISTCEVSRICAGERRFIRTYRPHRHIVLCDS